MTFNLDEVVCQSFVEKYNDKKKFRDELKSKYKYIIAYHATRLSDREVSGIYNEGLKISSKELYIEKAKRHLILREDSLSLKNKITQYIIDFFKNDNQNILNEINFGLFSEDLIYTNPHYLLFGPEGLLILAQKLTEQFGFSFRNRLHLYGKPYLVSVKIDINLVEDDWIIGIFEFWNENLDETSLVVDFNITPESIVKITETIPSSQHNHSIY